MVDTMEIFWVQMTNTASMNTRKTMKKRNVEQSVQLAHTHTNTICIWRWMCDVFTVFSLTFSSFASLLLLLCCYCCHHFSNRLALNRTHRTKRVSFSSHTHTQYEPIVIEYSEMQLPALSAIFLHTFFSQFRFCFCFVCVFVFFVLLRSLYMHLGLVLVKRKHYRIVIEED